MNAAGVTANRRRSSLVHGAAAISTERKASQARLAPCMEQDHFNLVAFQVPRRRGDCRSEEIRRMRAAPPFPTTSRAFVEEALAKLNTRTNSWLPTLTMTDWLAQANVVH
jgi:hypothetical protein